MALFAKKQSVKKPVKTSAKPQAKRPTATIAKRQSPKSPVKAVKKQSVQSHNVNKKPISATLKAVNSRPVTNQNRRNTVSAKNPRATAAVKKPISKRPPQKRVNNTQAINSKIKTQSPKSRLATKSNKKIKGGVKNFEIKSRPKQVNHKFYIKKKKVKEKGMFKKKLILFLIAFALFFGIFVLCFSLSLTSSASTNSYILQIGKTQEDKNSTVEVPQYEIPKEIAERNGTKYIPMYLMSEYCDLTVTGTPKQLKYSSRVVSGQNIRFNVNSKIAFVNGIKVILKNAPVLYNGKLYVPVEFFTDYSEGLSFEFSEENNTLVMSKNVIEYDPIEKEDITSELTFKLATPVACAAIAQPGKQEGEKNYEKYFDNDDDDDDDYDYDYDDDDDYDYDYDDDDDYDYDYDEE